MTPEPLILSTPGLTLTALAWGPPDGIPVLAVHGWLDNAASFARLAPLLPALRLVALDLPGHGLSEHRPPGVSYYYADWIVDVAAAGEALGWERYALLGHSMGAGITSLVAGALPERITRLALIEGLGPMAVSPAESPERMRRSITQRTARERKRPRRHPDREAAVTRLREANPSLSLEGARLLVERGTEEGPEGVRWRADSRLRGLSPFRMSEEQVRAFLSEVRCPTLLVRAEGGYAYNPSILAARRACLASSELHCVPGGHHVHLDDPQAVLPLLGPFLQVDSGSTPTATAREGGEDLGDAVARLQVLQSIKALILDVDGVLTRGVLEYGPDGNDRLSFDVKDGMGIAMLRREGLQVALLSGRASPAVRRRAEELGIEHACLGIRDKPARLERLLDELGVSAREVAYLGDDLNDVAVMRRVGYPAAPADARPEARAAARYVCGRPGGQGAVRELAERILKAQGRWERVLEHYGAAS